MKAGERPDVEMVLALVLGVLIVAACTWYDLVHPCIRWRWELCPTTDYIAALAKDSKLEPCQVCDELEP